MRTPIVLGVVGLCERGLALAATLERIPNAEVRVLCEPSSEGLLRIRPSLPHVRVTRDVDDLLDDELVDALVIAVPAYARHELVCRALEADKHLLIEGPLASTSEQAEDIARRAERRGRALVVANESIFHPAVRRLKELVQRGGLGDVYYLYRNHQGPPDSGRDKNVLWSFGVHDIPLILHLLLDQPVEVSAHGESYVDAGAADIVFSHLHFATGISVHLHWSWLDAHQVRRLSVVGSRGTAEIDELASERKLTVYERSVAPDVEAAPDGLRVGVGDIVSPRITEENSLRLMCEDFLNSVRVSMGIVTGGREAVAAIRLLETLQRSLDRDGTVEQVVGESVPGLAGNGFGGQAGQLVRLPFQSRLS